MNHFVNRRNFALYRLTRAINQLGDQMSPAVYEQILRDNGIVVGEIDEE